MENREEELNKLICDLLIEKKALQKENKALRDEVERLKAEQKGIAPRMVRCS